jgi:hypothetical protein
MVMLGQMFVQSRKFGGRFLTYPSHPSIFMPGPVFEEVLTKADCNRMRDDISEVEVCKRIANVFQVSLTYMTDEEQWGVPDNWFAAALVRLLGYEDCESWAKAICSGIDYYQLKFGAFKTLSVMYAGGHITLGGTPYGHGFVGLISDTSTDLKDSFIIEATDNWASSPMPISTAKAMYDMAWGLIGWVREEYADGTYTINGSDRWWETPGVDAMRITGGLANFVKRLAGADEGKLLAEQKREALRKFSEERRKQEEV